jgi:hypothetical protein
MDFNEFGGFPYEIERPVFRGRAALLASGISCTMPHTGAQRRSRDVPSPPFARTLRAGMSGSGTIVSGADAAKQVAENTWQPDLCPMLSRASS